MKAPHCLSVLREPAQVVLRNDLVSICYTEAGDQVGNLGLQLLQLVLFLVHLRHNRDDLAEHSDQHVHDGERGKEQVHEHEDVVLPVCGQQLADELGLLREHALQEQAVHGLRHSVEAALGDLRARQELHEHHRKDVDDEDQEHQRCGDGADALEHALHEDHELGHAAKKPRHTRHAREAEHAENPQDRGMPGREVAFGAVHFVQCDDRPRLPGHQQDQYQVKDKPSVSECVELPPEGEEARQDFEGEIAAEEIVHHLEYPRRLAQYVGLVVVRLDGNPHRVQRDDNQGQVLEALARSDPLADAVLLVQRLHSILRLPQGFKNASLQAVSAWEERPRLLQLGRLADHASSVGAAALPRHHGSLPGHQSALMICMEADDVNTRWQ
mmetsp:Transcript_105142/g.279825  ORF Transcript_105142/g.279825 Transcript_105142/m.279825 type:complete len:384 (-) Transcript_105142:391-1542(-)